MKPVKFVFYGHSLDNTFHALKELCLAVMLFGWNCNCINLNCGISQSSIVCFSAHYVWIQRPYRRRQHFPTHHIGGNISFFLYFDWHFKAKCVKWMIQLTIILYSEHGVTSVRYHMIELHVIAANGTLHMLLLGWWYNSLRDLHGTFIAVLVLLWQNTQSNETMKLTLIALFVVGWGVLEIKWTIYLMPYCIYFLFLRISRHVALLHHSFKTTGSCLNDECRHSRNIF